jgi:uncharacterized protein (TIGR01619 family)
MERGWTSYFTGIDGKPASILLDLDAGTDAQKELRPYLCLLHLQLAVPSEDGLPEDEELEQLSALEDQIEARLAASHDGQWVGRCTHDGRRTFFFYLARPESVEPVLQDCFKDFSGYRWKHSVREEANWAAYFEFLYPSGEEMQVVSNQDVLQALLEEGDTLETPRRVDHWLYFPSAETLERCKKAIAELNYEIEEGLEEGQEEEQWYLQIYREDSVEPATIDAATLELYRLAKEYGGKYDGWETWVVRQ